MKKQTFRCIALMIAILLIVSCFAGCGKKVNDKDEQGRTIISIGAWPIKEGEEMDRWNARKAAFEEANPDVVVIPDQWKFDIKTFYAKAAGGQLPGVYNTNYTEIASMIESGYSANLAEVMSKRGYDGMWNPQMLELVSNDEGIFAFPYDAYVLGLSYNTELFAAAGLVEEDGTPKQPKNWDELLEFAIKIKEKTGKPGFVLPTSGNAGGWLFTPFAWSYGVDFMEKGEDGKWKATFNSPEAAAALQWIKDLKWKYDVIPANTLVDNPELRKIFATGNAGMVVTAGNFPRYVVQYGMTPDQFGIMAYPAGPKRHVTLLGGGLFGINQTYTEDQIDACLRWIEDQYSFNLTDTFKKTTDDEIKTAEEQGQLIGVKTYSIWNDNAESKTYRNELIESRMNVNPNQVRLYNEFIENCPAEIQAEEPVCCQELYNILDSCIQAVLTDRDADPAEVLEKANKDFQVNYLDNITY